MTARRRRERTDGSYRRRRLLGFAILGGLVLFLLAAAWVVVTAVMARSALKQVQADLNAVKARITAGDVTAARASAVDLQRDAGRAHRLTTGPAWAAAAALPGVGAPFTSVRGLTAGVDQLSTSTVPDLLTVTGELDPKKLRVNGDTFDVSALAAAAPVVHRVATSTQQVADRIAALPGRTWLPPVDSGRDQLLTKLRDLSASLTTADRATAVLPVMLGANGPKRYFVGFENEAESRGLGGLPGQFAIVVADHGKVTFTRFEQDGALAGVSSKLSLPAYSQRYGEVGLDNYLNSTISPNFPWVGQIWAAMWRNASGEQVDGAVALDPTALSYLLRVTGPAALPDGSAVSADNVVALTQSTAYSQFGSDVAARKNYLVAVAAAAERKVLSSSGNTGDLVKALARGADERRVLAWSAEPSVEAVLAQSPFGGQLPEGGGPFTGVTVTNAAGNKLDYYLDRTVSYVRSGCGATRTVNVTVTLTNGAPSAGLSAYVTNRSDNPPYPVKPGDNKLIVNVYATRGAQLTGLSGAPGQVLASSELGNAVFVTELELRQGATQTLTFQFSEPAGSGPVTVLRQPLVRPLNETVSDRGCSR